MQCMISLEIRDLHVECQPATAPSAAHAQRARQEGWHLTKFTNFDPATVRCPPESTPG